MPQQFMPQKGDMIVSPSSGKFIAFLIDGGNKLIAEAKTLREALSFRMPGQRAWLANEAGEFALVATDD